MRKTLEQACRDLLCRAIDDKLVDYRPFARVWSSGELVGMANLLKDLLEDDLLDEMDCEEEDG